MNGCIFRIAVAAALGIGGSNICRADSFAKDMANINGSISEARVAVPVPARPVSRAYEQDWVIAETSIKELHKAATVGYSEATIARLLDIAKRNPKNEALQKLIVKGLVDELAKTSKPGYSLHVVSNIMAMASQASDSVKRLAVTGVMEDVRLAVTVPYSEGCIAEVTSLARKSSPDIKSLAIGLMLKELRNNNRAGYSELLQAQIDAVNRS
ncbi:MAG: hypothetical protein A2X28_04580 [Elusimicrobia bacterium GWA2_56_46]|nr:MAG: hypothetical protein A2X28_04580 [Elusimicrobia bacterium GWA2_56_46]OGR56151.1 MAG: hypothetical protein A2X39_08000 [Elusimicrobia bacterium GWC2_56_31]HBW23076.1 hypothetical protein [Elusimicrobiota bacterium]